MTTTTLIQHLTNAYSSLQQKFKKGKDRHIKEIQTFQKYFETVYDPDDLSWTIRKGVVIIP